MSQAQVGITEQSSNNAETRCEMNERECKQGGSWETGENSANVTREVILVCMTVTNHKCEAVFSKYTMFLDPIICYSG